MAQTLAARRQELWNAVRESKTAVPDLFKLIVDHKLYELPAHPVLWSRSRSLVLTDELVEWAWLHWFSQRGVWREGGDALDALLARIVTPDRQLVVDASTSMLAPNANASASVVPFTTVASTETRAALADRIPRVADAFRGLTTLPIPAILEAMITSGITKNRLEGLYATAWDAMHSRPKAPEDTVAADLLDLLVNAGCTDTFHMLAGAERVAFVAKLAGAIPADAPQLTFTD